MENMIHKTRILVVMIVTFLFLMIVSSQSTARKKITYFATEHPKVTYYNPKYIKYVNLTSQRYGRKNPFYYVSLHVESLVVGDHRYKIHFYFYELLTNVYKRGFIEMHMSICDLIEKDNFFGTAIRRNVKPCPLPPGYYHLYNMTIPIDQVPKGFPFTKGRIYANLTSEGDMVASGYIDLELKQFTQT